LDGHARAPASVCIDTQADRWSDSSADRFHANQVTLRFNADFDLQSFQTFLGSPEQLVTDLGSRVGLLHVKDGPADEPPSSMVAVGDGAVDVPGVLAASPSAQWHIVELDRCDTDMFDAVERSYDYLVGHGLSRGRS